MESLNHFLVKHDFFDSPEVGGVNIVSHSQVMLDVFFVKYPLVVLGIEFGANVAGRGLKKAPSQRLVDNLLERQVILPGLLFERVRQIVIYR